MMTLQLPWTFGREDYAEAEAYTIFQPDGARCAVGLLADDANLICRLVNATAMPLTLDTIWAYFAGNTLHGYGGLHRLPEREVDEAVYDHFLSILPPRYLTTGFAVPEALTSDAGGATYSCFEKRGASFFHSYRRLAS